MQDDELVASLPVKELSLYNWSGDQAELDRIVDQETPIIGASILIILGYMSLILGGKPFVKSRCAGGACCSAPGVCCGTEKCYCTVAERLA